MKQEITPPMLIAAVVAVVVIIGVISWINFGAHGSSGSLTGDQLKAVHAAKRKREGD
jgi:hypothetical protein